MFTNKITNKFLINNICHIYMNYYNNDLDNDEPPPPRPHQRLQREVAAVLQVNTPSPMDISPSPMDISPLDQNGQRLARGQRKKSKRKQSKRKQSKRKQSKRKQSKRKQSRRNKSRRK